MAEENDSIGWILDVQVKENVCTLNLVITNESSEDVILQFSSSQKYDFVVTSMDGKPVWTWSDGKMFTQMLENVELRSGESLSYEESSSSLSSGNYRAQAFLNIEPSELESNIVEFSIESSTIYPISGKVKAIMDNVYLLGDDGTAYSIKYQKEDFRKIDNQKITTDDYETESIEGSVDKVIRIKDYKILEK